VYIMVCAKAKGRALALPVAAGQQTNPVQRGRGIPAAAGGSPGRQQPQLAAGSRQRSHSRGTSG
jgi:hypothetical protein